MTVVYWFVLIFSILLMVAGFLVPPMGVIDGSVLIGVGLVMIFTCVSMAIISGINTKISVDADDKKVEIETSKKEEEQ